MSDVDYIFLGGFFLALIILLVRSPVIRAIAWDSLRHPFTASVIEVHGSKVEIRHVSSEKTHSNA